MVARRRPDRRSGSYDIWALAVRTGALERITDAPGSEYGPSWSPDGTMLAYAASGAATPPASGAAGIRVLEPGGAGPPRLAVSADGAQFDAPINPPGLSLNAEMEALVRYGGMTPLEVLRATTSVSGAALGYEGVLGVAAPGAIADLLVIDGNPLADIAAARNVRTVILGGRARNAEDLLRRN